MCEMLNQIFIILKHVFIYYQVKGIGMRQSFNRAVNIHGSNDGLIENNVIYNIMGGAFFLEDGVEVGNKFKNNLAVSTIMSFIMTALIRSCIKIQS